jgi:hypothetical protein
VWEVNAHRQQQQQAGQLQLNKALCLEMAAVDKKACPAALLLNRLYGRCCLLPICLLPAAHLCIHIYTVHAADVHVLMNSLLTTWPSLLMRPLLSAAKALVPCQMPVAAGAAAVTPAIAPSLLLLVLALPAPAAARSATHAPASAS